MREADELGLHRIEAGGLGVEGEAAGGAGLRDPGFELRAASVTVSYFERSIFWPWHARRQRRRRPAAWPRRTPVAALPPASRGVPAPAGTLACGALRAADRSTGGGASAPSPSAMRFVSVANSISRRKPSSAVGLGIAHAQLLDRHRRRARPP